MCLFIVFTLVVLQPQIHRCSTAPGMGAWAMNGKEERVGCEILASIPG